MRRAMLCLFGFLFVSILSAQQKANYLLADKFSNLSRKHLTDNSLTLYPNFLSGSDRFWYSFKTEEGTEYYLVDPAKREKRLLFDNDQLLSQIAEMTRKPYSGKEPALQQLQFDKNGESFTFQLDNIKYRYRLNTKKVEQVDSVRYEGGIYSWMKYAPDSNYIVFAKNHNLYIMGNKAKGKDTTHVQLTTDGVKDYSYCSEKEAVDSVESESVAVWMKDSRKIYAIREDERKVEELFIVDFTAAPRPKLKSYKYAMPGDKELGQSELVVIDIETKRTTVIDTRRWQDQYLSVLYTSKDGKRLYFERRNRHFNEQEICVADVETGKSKVLIHETDKPFMDYKMAAVHFLNDGKEILYRSERTGWGHYYLYDGENGRLKRAVTSGGWVAGPITEIDTVGRNIYFYGLGKEKTIDPYYYVLYRVNLDRPESIRRLTDEDATHSVHFSKSFRYFVDIYGRVDMVPKIFLRDAEGRKIMELERPDMRRLYEMGWKAPERFKVKAADGVTDLYGVMFKPYDFDSTRTYPIISVVYPGPHYEYVPTQFAVEHDNMNRLAQVGFVVIAVGHRGGTPMRGKFYHTYSAGRLRDYPLADDKYAIEQLADRYPFIDRTKVGIMGHSGGGFMSTAALLTYPDFYSAAVSCSGNHDNSIYNQWWGETHHGVKEEKKTIKDSVNGDREESVFSFRVPTNMQLAEHYKGGLLLVHGMMDDNVHPAHTLRMAHALIEANKNFDMLLLPRENHGYGGDAELFFERKMWFHFAKYLLGDASADYFYDIQQYRKKQD